MIELQRITTEYIETEDRIRITGTVGAGAPVALWLTQRLLQRLLPHLLQWLEVQGAEIPRLDVMHSFAQQVATAQITPQAPVKVAAANTHWLVDSVELVRGDQGVRMIFKGATGQIATMTLNAILLRQWLGIVYTGFRKANWPQTVWPNWMLEGSATVQQSAVVLH